MSSQLVFQPPRDSPNTSQTSFPFLGSHNIVTTPLAYQHRPTKRVRVADGQSCHNGTTSTVQRHREEHENPQAVRIASVPNATACSTFVEQDSQQRSASVPMPCTQKRSRRKGQKPPQDGDPFIIEAISFPDQQPWLQVKPRRRKAGIDATKEPVLIPTSALPEEGEVLSLNKDADRIAALIAQKRRENESSQFRQRMATQQRVHRGEPDKSEELIAASSDELKRKLELSAKGIFEDKAPDGKESEAEPESEPSLPPASPIQSLGDEMEIVDSEVAASGDLATMQIPHSPQRQDVVLAHAPFINRADEDDSGEEEVNRFEAVQTRAARHTETAVPVAPQTCLQYSQTAYYQTMVTTQMTMAANQAPLLPIAQAPQHTQLDMVYSQPMVAHHLQQYVPNWYGAQAQVQQPWTHQIFHALPSTQTPLLERSHIAHEVEHDGLTREEDSRPAHSVSAMGQPSIQQNQMVNLFGSDPQYSSSNSSSSPEDTNESLHGHSNPSATTNLFSNLDSALNPAHFEPQSAVLRSNMNMFTRLARENGVIGGNNNVAEMVAPRRNMFDSNR